MVYCNHVLCPPQREQLPLSASTSRRAVQSPALLCYFMLVAVALRIRAPTIKFVRWVQVHQLNVRWRHCSGASILQTSPSRPQSHPRLVPSLCVAHDAAINMPNVHKSTASRCAAYRAQVNMPNAGGGHHDECFRWQWVQARAVTRGASQSMRRDQTQRRSRGLPHESGRARHCCSCRLVGYL